MLAPTSMVVARVAIAYFSTGTIPVMSWVVIHQSKRLPLVIRNNHMICNSYRKRYHAVSLNPYFRSTRTRQYDESRLHMSHDRESADSVKQTPSSSFKVPSLTSELLSIRFRDVFAHFRSLQQPTSDDNTYEPQTIKIPDESTIRMNLIRTRHANLELDKCRIDRSTIPNAGYGVYATTAIQRNELITLYPGDAIIQWKHKDHVDPAMDGGMQIFFGTHIPESERAAAALDNSNKYSPMDHNNSDTTDRIFMNHIPTARGYEVRINETISVIGDPNRKSDPAYLGHMINDYCMIPNDDIVDNTDENENETIRLYNIQSIQKSNCKINVGIDQCHVEIIATRDIASSEELFLSYGSNYWLSRRRSVSTPITKGTSAVKEPTASNTSKPGFGNNNTGGKVKTKRK